MSQVGKPTDKIVQAVPPKVTSTPLINPVPVIVTEVPPASAPLEAVTKVTVGVASGLMISLRGEEHEDKNKTRHSETVLFLKLYFLQKCLISMHTIKKCLFLIS